MQPEIEEVEQRIEETEKCVSGERAADGFHVDSTKALKKVLKETVTRAMRCVNELLSKM